MNELTALLISLGFEGKNLEIILSLISKTVQLKILSVVSGSLNQEGHEKLAKLMSNPGLLSERTEFLEEIIRKNGLAPKIQTDLGQYFAGIVDRFAKNATQAQKESFVNSLSKLTNIPVTT